MAVVAVAVARRNSRKARGVVGRRIVADATGNIVALPPRLGGQRLGNVVSVSATLVLGLAFHVVGQLCPFRIRGDVPARGTDALHPAGVG